MNPRPPFVWHEAPFTYRGRLTQQQLNNEYFYEMLESINRYFVKHDMTFEWKEDQINYLISMVGLPVKLTHWQNFLANVFML